MRTRTRGALMAGLALAACLLAACADQETSDQASRFTPGATTRAEAVAALGPPNSVYEQADGSRILTWAHGGGLFNPSETHGLSIQFGPDNRMIRIVSNDMAQH